MSTTKRTSWSETSTFSASSHSRARVVRASNGLRTASGVVAAMLLTNVWLYSFLISDEMKPSADSTPDSSGTITG